MPAFANACLVCPCVVSECVSVLTPPALPFHPSLQSACEIWSSNCQAWTPHSFHGPANQHCVTLTTANYHCDGELSLTVALGEYGCISLNKSAQLPTHTPSHCCLTGGFSTLLHLAQNVRLSWSICLKEKEKGCIISQHKLTDSHRKKYQGYCHMMWSNKNTGHRDNNYCLLVKNLSK